MALRAPSAPRGRRWIVVDAPARVDAEASADHPHEASKAQIVTSTLTALLTLIFPPGLSEASGWKIS
jgi:hypothetical protein